MFAHSNPIRIRRGQTKCGTGQLICRTATAVLQAIFEFSGKNPFFNNVDYYTFFGVTRPPLMLSLVGQAAGGGYHEAIDRGSNRDRITVVLLNIVLFLVIR